MQKVIIGQRLIKANFYFGYQFIDQPNIQGNFHSKRRQLREYFRYTQSVSQLQKLQKVKMQAQKMMKDLQRTLNPIVYKQVEQLIDLPCNKYQNPHRISIKKSKIQMGKSFYHPKLLKQISKQRQRNSILQQIRQNLESPEQFQLISLRIENKKLNQLETDMNTLFGKRKGKQKLLELKQLFEDERSQPVKGAKFLKISKGLHIYKLFCKYEDKKHINDQLDSLNMLIMGGTGVGKSTFVNAIANYLMDIQMGDDFRYILNEDCLTNQNGLSATQNVEIYQLPGNYLTKKKKVHLIDVPGFGDTGGIKKDIEHFKNIRQKITSSISHLNLIVFILKATQTRSTTQLKYILEQIFGMFSSDMAPNILFLTTFADNTEPKIIPTLTSNYSNLIESIKFTNNGQKWFVKINNSALFQQIDNSDPLSVNFFKMGKLCLKETVKRMINSQSLSTKSSRKVINYRQKIEEQVDEILPLIHENMKLEQQIRIVSKTRIQNIGGMQKRKDYEQTIQDQKICVQSAEQRSIICINCKIVCHFDCQIVNNAEINQCSVMNKNGECLVCHCTWVKHISDKKTVKKRIKFHKTKLTEVEKKYLQLKYQIELSNSYLFQLATAYNVNLQKIQKASQKLLNIKDQLKELELRPVNSAFFIKYLEYGLANFESQLYNKELIQQYKTIIFKQQVKISLLSQQGDGETQEKTLIEKMSTFIEKINNQFSDQFFRAE